MLMKFISQLRKIKKTLKLCLDYYLIRSSGLFDGEWYLEKNPDVAQAGLEPVRHYLEHGGFEGRDPGPGFSSGWYLDTYEDVRNSGINPLVHYLKFGRKEGRRDTRVPFHHGEEDINASLIRSSGLFDEVLYLKNNPDVVLANTDPVLHYLNHGGFEGRDPGTDFSNGWYLDTYEDVRNSGINPLVHYLKYGRKQGRKAHPPIFKLGRIYDYCRETNSMFFEDVPERIYLRRPNILGNFLGDLEQGEALCPPAYVSVLKHVVIFGGSPLVITSEGLVLDDELADFNGGEFGKKSTLVKLLQGSSVMLDYDKKPSLQIKEGVLLSCGHDNNYFHWLVECLPKLVLIDELDDLKQFKDVPLLIPSGLHRNLETALKRININDRQLIHLEPNAACRVERLIFPSALSRIIDRYQGSPVFDVDIVLSHKWISKVGQGLKKDRQSDQIPWRKLFLSRKKGLRALGNLEELEFLLLRQGFQIIDLENMSLDFQIELFSQASLIVAPTGAALTNMLFCRPGTKVVVLMSNHEVTNYYLWSTLSDITNLDVTIIAGSRLFNLTNYWSVHDDYVIDPNILLDVIKQSVHTPLSME